MHLTHKQWLLILAVLIASCGAWGVVLKMFLDSSLAFKYACAWWFFGGCFVAAVIVAALEYTGVLDDRDEKESSGPPPPRHLNCKSTFDHRTAEAFNKFGLSAEQAAEAFARAGKRIGDIKIEGDINPALTEMKNRIIEIKKAAEKGIDRE